MNTPIERAPRRDSLLTVSGTLIPRPPAAGRRGALSCGPGFGDWLSTVNPAAVIAPGGVRPRRAITGQAA